MNRITSVGCMVFLTIFAGNACAADSSAEHQQKTEREETTKPEHQFVAHSGAVVDRAASKVEVIRGDQGWQLIRNGQPYYVLGGGGQGSLSDLAAAGANSNRTWGVDDLAETRARLDEASSLNLSVAVGIWLEHERKGMDYRDFDFVVEQMETTLQHVRNLKDHPAVLVWGIGNEMEGDGSNAAIWSHIELLAQRVKQEDPHHPVMTVIAELGDRKIEAIHKLCPSVDIIGVNSYGGSKSVPERYRKQGGTKPYIVTEFGPDGTWEVPKNSFGAITEPTSTTKAVRYRESFNAFRADSELCVGSYAFLWGEKQEGTATWFGMLLPDGKRTEAANAMAELWSGKTSANACPVIEPLQLSGSDKVEPGATVEVSLNFTDPENDTVDVRWELMAEAEATTGGDFQEAPPNFRDAIQTSDLKGAVFKMPTTAGVYRIYAYAEDEVHNNAATANVPVRVKDGELDEPGTKVELPWVVYDEQDDAAKKENYVPSGLMGSTESIELDPNFKTDPKEGATCLRVVYKQADNWGGAVWQHPPNDWGAQPGGFDLTGATKLSFWAKGKAGGETVKFGFGIIKRDQSYFDTAQGESELVLTNEWKQYTLSCDDEDMRRIKTGFFWSLAGQGGPVEFYLDRIVFE